MKKTILFAGLVFLGTLMLCAAGCSVEEETVIPPGGALDLPEQPPMPGDEDVQDELVPAEPWGN